MVTQESAGTRIHRVIYPDLAEINFFLEGSSLTVGPNRYQNFGNNRTIYSLSPIITKVTSITNSIYII